MNLYDSLTDTSMGDVYDGAGASAKERSSTHAAAPGTAFADFLEGSGAAVTGFTGLPLASVVIVGAMALYLLKKYGD